MQLSEVRLRQIISEEVQARLMEHYIEKEIQILFEDSDDPEVQKAREEYKRLSRQGKKIPAALALTLGLGVGGLKLATDQHSDTEAAKTDAKVTQNMEKAASDEAQFDQFVTQLNNQYAFRWGKGDNAVVFAPGSKGKITVLPASYSIAVQALKDKKMNAERIDQGLRPTERYGEIDLDNLAGDKQEYQGDFEKNIDNFFKTHKGKFVNALDVVGAHDELDTVPASGTESMVIMVDPDKIGGDYYLPELGMTAADYYNSQYGEFMGSGEMAALDQSDEEMIVTPDDEERLNPELIQKTKERAASLKESKITWKNYKNRKKVLA
jgi:3-dehydroquinate dehydratase